MNGIKWDGSGGHSWWGENTKALLSIKDMISRPHKVQVSFGSDSSYRNSEAYVVLEGGNGHATPNVDDGLLSRIKRIHKKKKSINYIRLFNKGGYFISDDDGSEWNGIGSPCSKELKKNNIVEDFAFSEDGSWMIIRPNHHVGSTGVDSSLLQHINDFHNNQRGRNNRRTLQIQEHHASVRRE